MSTPKLQDEFVIYSKSNLSMVDINVLNLLYLPVMGVNAISLYSVVNSLITDNNPFTTTINVLKDLLNISLDDFIEAYDKLQAFALLDVYVRGSSFILTLNHPMTPKGFLQDSLFGNFLYSEVGDTNFKLLQKRFEVDVPKLKSAINVTKSFSDVYKYKPIARDFEIPGNFKDRLYKSDVNLTNIAFDFELFRNGLSKSEQIPEVNYPVFEKYITKTAFVYNFSEEDMRKVFKDSIINGEFNYNVLSKKANSHYRGLTGIRTSTFVEVNKNQYQVSNDDKTTVEYFETASTYDVLKTLSNNQEPQDFDLATIEQFYQDNDVSRGVLNALIMLAFRQTGGTLPHTNYLSKILGEWKRNDVKSFTEAVQYIKHRNNIMRDKQTKRNTGNKGKDKKVITNSYADDFLNEL